MTTLKAKVVTASVGPNMPGKHPTTEIVYGTGHQSAANALAVLFPGAKVVPGAHGSGSASSLTVILGDDYVATVATSPPPSGPTTTGPGTTTSPSGGPGTTVPPSDLKSRTADQDICTGLPKANHG